MEATLSHGVVHFEIPGDDPDKLASFYGDLFGWQIQKMPMDGMDYWMVGTVPTDQNGMPTEPGGINGGLYKRQAPGQGPVNYVNVESVDDYLAKAKSLGATVVVEKMPVAEMGWFAHLVDPQGNLFGIWETNGSAG
jgi:predicted enzyme related to lactoylglutathione lyase